MYIRVPWNSSSIWMPQSSSVVEGLGVPSDVGRHQSRTMSRPPGATAAHDAPKRPDRVRQLVQGVLEVDEVELLAERHVRVVRGSIRIRWPRPASLTWRMARATESGSYSTPTSSVAANRRAIAISHLPPPHATSRTRAAGG